MKVQDKQISLNLGSYSLFSTLKSIALILIIAFMTYLYFNEKDKRIEQEELIEASADKLEVWKNKDGENVAKIAVLETKNKNTFLAFKSQDSTIQELQKLVKDNRSLFRNSKGTAGIIKSETNIDAVGVTKVTQDSLNKFPIYESLIKDKWYTINSRATKDSTNVSLKTYHNLSLVMGSESQGLFKKRKTFATAKDSNPNSNIKDMRIYNVEEDTRRFTIGPYVGYGATVIDSEVKIGFQAGFGITYKLIQF